MLNSFIESKSSFSLAGFINQIYKQLLFKGEYGTTLGSRFNMLSSYFHSIFIFKHMYKWVTTMDIWGASTFSLSCGLLFLFSGSSHSLPPFLLPFLLPSYQPTSCFPVFNYLSFLPSHSSLEKSIQPTWFWKGCSESLDKLVRICRKHFISPRALPTLFTLSLFLADSISSAFPAFFFPSNLSTFHLQLYLSIDSIFTPLYLQ